MKNLKLIQILKTLKPDELKNFGKFIASPYFNKGRNLLPYFKELKKFSPGFDSTNLSREYIFGRLYKNRKFDKKALMLINKLNSDLLKMLEAYLITISTEKNQITREILLNEKYLEKGLHKLSLAELLKLKNDFFKRGINDTYYLPHQKVLSLTAEAYIGTGRMKEFHNTYKEYSDYVLLYMLTFYFEDYAHRKNFEIGSNVKINPSPAAEILSGLDFIEIIENIGKTGSAHGTFLKIYHHLYLCYKEPSDYSMFKKFKSLLFGNLGLFSHEEKFNLLNYLDTLCIISERLGFGKRDGDRLAIIELKIKNRILSFRENEIHHTTFDGIISIFINLKKYKEAEEFIHGFSDWLPAELRERYKNMAISRVCFGKQEYGKTLEILAKLPELALNNISVVLLKAISLFEMMEYDAAETTLESFKKYLINNKTISKANGSHFLGFAEGLHLLIKNISGSGENEPVRKLQQIFKKYPAAFRKEWLLSKANELENPQFKRK